MPNTPSVRLALLAWLIAAPCTAQDTLSKIEQDDSYTG